MVKLKPQPGWLACSSTTQSKERPSSQLHCCSRGAGGEEEELRHPPRQQGKQASKQSKAEQSREVTTALLASLPAWLLGSHSPDQLHDQSTLHPAPPVEKEEKPTPTGTAPTVAPQPSTAEPPATLHPLKSIFPLLTWVFTAKKTGEWQDLAHLQHARPKNDTLYVSNGRQKTLCKIFNLFYTPQFHTLIHLAEPQNWVTP